MASTQQWRQPCLFIFSCIFDLRPMNISHFSLSIIVYVYCFIVPFAYVAMASLASIVLNGNGIIYRFDLISFAGVSSSGVFIPPDLGGIGRTFLHGQHTFSFSVALRISRRTQPKKLHAEKDRNASSEERQGIKNVPNSINIKESSHRTLVKATDWEQKQKPLQLYFYNLP